MDPLFIVAFLLFVVLVMVMMVIAQMTRNTKDLKKENAWLREIIRIRDDQIEDLQEERTKNDQV